MDISIIRDRVAVGERLEREECEWLFRSECDLHQLGLLAAMAKQRRWGDRVFWRRNLHVNPTNICKLRCPLCAFSRDANDPGAFLLTEDDIVSKVTSLRDQITELHIVGGIHPELPYEWYRHLIERMGKEFPELRCKAWTAQEITHFAAMTGRSVESILTELKGLGLAMLPGGGAEIFAPAVRRVISPDKIDAETWLSVHRTAHRLGIPTTATILFGHLESTADRVDHLLRLRQLQDETAGFVCLIPLTFHPNGTRLTTQVPQRVSAADRLRMVAASRLILDNVPHIKAYWVSLDVSVAQIALGYGADDFDGTIGYEKVHHEAGATSPRGMDPTRIETLIRETGSTPCEDRGGN